MKRETDSSAKAPSLSEYIRQNRKSRIEVPPVSGPAIPGEAPSAPRGTGRTEAAAAPSAVLDPIIQDAFLRAYQSAAVRGTRLTPLAGGALRVQAVTDSETIVFGALVGTARGLKESRMAGRLVDKVELYMSTSVGENAGKFVIRPEDAEALLNGTIPPAKFFVANVEL